MGSTLEDMLSGEFQSVASLGDSSVVAAATEGLAGAVAQAFGASSDGSSAGSIAESVLGSVFGMVPLAKAIFSIFGGGGDDSPAPLVKYAMPASIDFEGADVGDSITAANYDQAGTPRADTAAGTATGGTAPQITVNVQAMDAQSFLDHSNEIAQAVRDAMLNSNSINDVVNEL